MHFVGIKCEVCSKLENTNDAIENMPKGWMALVPYVPCKLFNGVRENTLHFCSFECLHTWTREQAAKKSNLQEITA